MRFLLSLMATNLASSLSLRLSFWLQAGFMAVNNVLFFSFWWILLERFDDIRGWALGDMALLFGLSAAGFGLAYVLAGGMPELGRRIEEGGLDPLLTQPKSVLLQALASRTHAAGWGDIVSGLAMIALSGRVDAWSWPLVLLGVLLSACTFVASGVTFHSLVFFMRHGSRLARQAGEMLLTFTMYPPSLFGGGLRAVLFTILPAAFAAYLPVELLREFDGLTLLAAVAGVAAHSCFALWLFDRGLRRYTSGNRVGVHD